MTPMASTDVLQKRRTLTPGHHWRPRTTCELDTGAALPENILGLIIRDDLPAKPIAVVRQYDGQAVVLEARSLSGVILNDPPLLAASQALLAEIQAALNATAAGRGAPA